MNGHSNYLAYLLLAAGFFIRYQIGRRRFNRRSMTGIQLYSNYFRALLTSFAEYLFNIVGAVCIIIGLISLIIHK